MSRVRQLPPRCSSASSCALHSRRRATAAWPTTHVLVDEVHERSVDNDFLLALRTLFPARRERTARRRSRRRRRDARLRRRCLPHRRHLTLAHFRRTSRVGFDEAVSFPGRFFPVETLASGGCTRVDCHVVDCNADWCVLVAARKRRQAAASLLQTHWPRRGRG